ncbi:hypothetical protein [Arthrobacter sp. efr-133-R2A-120]|uniref:hypothetical protein n=1 Tax=Arthrobacter sp. efr-133-R2A-120 TaxID=3040277 RepID=UPI00254AC7FD|nr:hypothetical protein [Arthrobacter sp. efr-133-R2A-120]
MSDAFKHGASGYRHHNCRCEVCREGHSEAQRRRRAKLDGMSFVPAKAGLTVVRAPFPAFPADDPPVVERGPAPESTESAVEAEIDALAVRAGIWTKECARLESQAMSAARIVDKVIADGRVHLAPAHYRLVNDALEKLRVILAPVRQTGDADAFEDDEFIRSLGTPVDGHRDHLPWTYPPEKVTNPDTYGVKPKEK